MNDEKIKVEENEVLILPMIPLRGLTAFPHASIHFDVQRDKSKEALDYALEHNQPVFLATQKDIRVEDPSDQDLYSVGVVAEVRQTFKVSPNVVRILVEGSFRARMIVGYEEDECHLAEVEPLPMKQLRTSAQKDRAEAMVRVIKELFEQYAYLAPTMPKDILLNVAAIEDPVYLVEYICSNLMLPLDIKQSILEESAPMKRLEILISCLGRENEIQAIENEVLDKTKDAMDQNQRDYYLREQMRVISQELGEENSQTEAAAYYKKVDALGLSEESLEKLRGDVDRLVRTPPGSQESAVLRQYLDTVLELPFGVHTKDKINITATEKLLDKEHYGLKKVKERMIELLAVRQLAPDMKGQIVCLVGPPGVGKTSIARSIATAMGRKYVRISLGGVRDESDIRGHRKTYVGAMPGRIIAGLKQAKSANPLMLLDEVDKMGNDFRGDPASAMLEVLDPEQNREFVDHYVEVPFDLSEVLFITTANSLSGIPAPLMDRMEIIQLGSYTREEKFQIAKRHLLPKQLSRHGLLKKQCKMSNDALYSLIDYYTREAGVRSLERTIAALCRKAAKKIVEGKKSVLITAHNLEEYMGARRFRPDHIYQEDEVGMVNGLAFTTVGGEMLRIEVAIMKGSGKIELTGSLGDVIKESARIAISYVRSRAEDYGINPDFYKTCDIHIHAPEGAVPKDGPSAGLAMTTALISALTGIPVRKNIAMTGEVTLRGRALPIGGLKEKSMAAYRAGVDTILFPQENEGDLDEVDDIVKEHVHFVPVEEVDDVLKKALTEFPNSSHKSSSKVSPRSSRSQKGEEGSLPMIQ